MPWTSLFPPLRTRTLLKVTILEAELLFVLPRSNMARRDANVYNVDKTLSWDNFSFENHWWERCSWLTVVSNNMGDFINAQAAEGVAVMKRSGGPCYKYRLSHLHIHHRLCRKSPGIICRDILHIPQPVNHPTEDALPARSLSQTNGRIDK